MDAIGAHINHSVSTEHATDPDDGNLRGSKRDRDTRISQKKLRPKRLPKTRAKAVMKGSDRWRMTSSAISVALIVLALIRLGSPRPAVSRYWRLPSDQFSGVAWLSTSGTAVTSTLSQKHPCKKLW